MELQAKEPVVAIFHQDAFPDEISYTPLEDLKLLRAEEQTLVHERSQTAANPSDQFSLIDKHIKTVAVIGAGPAGLPTAKWLKDEGLSVTIFERNLAAGGTWIYDSTPPLNPTYPSEIPTEGAQPSLPPIDQTLPYTQVKDLDDDTIRFLLEHAPPNPCYKSLGNNVATPLLKYKDLDWPKNTPWYTGHQVICQYLQNYASAFGLNEVTEFNTSVERVTEIPGDGGWHVLTKTTQKEIIDGRDVIKVTWSAKTFDAVVVATGHYHVPYIPNFHGLSEWQAKWPQSVSHSKSYRVPEPFDGQNVLVIGNGTSALDIMRDIASYTNDLYQAVRDSQHHFDEKYLQLRKELSSWVPAKVQGRKGIKQFIAKDTLQNSIIEFDDGQTLTGIDHIIICTGYMFNFHFLDHLHRDEATHRKFGSAVPTDDHVLVKRGDQVYNLHKDIFYIPNPTLSFVGVPFHIATFSFFEYQAFAVARAYSKRAALPDTATMRQEWNDRLQKKGGGREFHALGAELEQEYIQDILSWLNRDSAIYGGSVIKGHDSWWFDVKSNALAELKKKMKTNAPE
ncbi:hypothetical protein K450DRAFT_291058 [Umbelopsis ramanniana AG]|uniref:Dimethylaniline monooxygenase n=1 Tax=Umbelopsis ramanniana AG TaxID=1314678 RepID=A0AAD5E3I1_UMBRA|nr:uncharacterized protein K450DRAFT_291058 [Umbelopsis ramanniana AG]KAI8576726.1 hypothetical protein K450DRAFT_291058 [Umbelopsis ramanniana AG]